ncbi:MAG TPA: tetratricopeptide repeat protein [Ignavibacteria bacterium]|nr:tetratricopeptide repeat protein [Ignavibacteria bacterium]HRF65387.1 tetratricopeptide repeat protein [Ignavibacteria bacterium]HRJ04264.1 tetratricopeptide repeat protein [Ignavibacteria bacterium]
MAKGTKKQEKRQKNARQVADISFNLNLNKTAQAVILAVLLLLSIGLPYYYINYAYSVNQYYSFPLDDPWIHLQFAKNIAEYGSFSYFKNEIVTAGSTSPLYTVILAAGFFITKNEMWLSYILGIIFFTLSIYYFYRLSSLTFPKENWLAIAAALLLVFDKWLNLITVTGMETTMYIFMLIACYYYYRKMNAIGFAVTLGLTFWTRPDALAFIGAIAIDYFLRVYLKNKAPKENADVTLFEKKDLYKIAGIFGFIMAAYFVMNYIISGSLLPNTYGAKIAYYSAEFRSRGDFLKTEVWEYFTESAYILIFIPFVFGIVKLINDSFRLRYNPLIPAFLFIAILIFMYWYKLPYAHRFGRYMMPVFPFYILLAVYGGRQFFTWLANFMNDKKLVNGLNMILLAGTVIYFSSGYYENRKNYQDQSRHIYIRQVVAAKWLKDNTPENSIIATHDVGAIAFYSERKVLDVVGLINPEFISRLNKTEFVDFVLEQMKSQKVSYMAFLKEWFQVVNDEPLIEFGDQNFEIMQIFRYQPDKIHILSAEVNSGIQYAVNFINARQYQQALSVLKQVAAMDPNSSLTYIRLAYVYTALNDPGNAEKSLLKAIEIYPGYRDAILSLANLYKAQNKISETKNIIGRYLETNPNDTTALRIISGLGETKQDSLKLK